MFSGLTFSEFAEADSKGPVGPTALAGDVAGEFSNAGVVFGDPGDPCSVKDPLCGDATSNDDRTGVAGALCNSGVFPDTTGEPAFVSGCAGIDPWS